MLSVAPGLVVRVGATLRTALCFLISSPVGDGPARRSVRDARTNGTILKSDVNDPEIIPLSPSLLSCDHSGSGGSAMGMFDRMADRLGIQTAGNAERMDVAASARLPRDHPVVLLAERAAERGMKAGDMELRQLFGDPTTRDAIAPVAPREDTPARYNWVARRTLDQMMPKIGEGHVDRRLPHELRLEMAGAIAEMVDPLRDARASLVSIRMRDEAAMSRRLVGYLQTPREEVVRRGVDMLRDASDEGLRAEFELVPGTMRMRIPQDDRGREAWIEERLQTEHALARAGAMPADGMLDAASRLDLSVRPDSDAPLMARYRYPEIVADAARAADETDRLSDIDLRFRFKPLGGMGSAHIPDGPERGRWVMDMLVEERQTAALSTDQQETLAAERKAIDVALPPVSRAGMQPSSIRVSVAVNAAQAAGI
jgi:hypothetical protein